MSEYFYQIIDPAINQAQLVDGAPHITGLHLRTPAETLDGTWAIRVYVKVNSDPGWPKFSEAIYAQCHDAPAPYTLDFKEASPRFL